MTWRVLPQQPGERIRLLLFVASAIAAVACGFVLVRPERVGPLIVHAGYYYILAVFGLWLVFGWRSIRGGRLEWSNARNSVVLFLLGATAFSVWTDSFAHKVLFDEYVLQGSAWHMHLTKEVGTPIRAYDFAGTWLVIDTFLDKRPYFFTFLVSVLHDLTGFRIANVFALNVSLTFLILSATFWVVRKLTGRVGPALVGVALFATLPLLGQNATGASMELLNLAMMAAVMIAAMRYLSEPGPDRLSFLVLGAVLLAQSRYESVLFVFPVAAVALLGWVRERRIILSWPAILAPLLLVPYVWHDRYVSTKPHLWQLREGEESRFALQYLAGNLEGARHFFLNVSPGQPNSVWLFLVGAAGVAWALVRLWRTRRSFIDSRWSYRPVIPVVALFALTMAANLAMLMFYYWSRLDEPVAARFALPIFFALSIAAGWFVSTIDRLRIPATRFVGYGVAAWVLIVAAPAYAHRFYTSLNLVMHELDWELEEVSRRPQPTFLITSKATLPYLLEKIPALNTSIARLRAPQIAWHMRHGTFREVLVSQVIRPTSAKGDPVVDPDEVLPASFHLETVAEKRFGARWIRISRIQEIADDVPAGDPSTDVK